ncbi:MAG: hypothetical protein GXP40_11035 [Chloroflexi bacterium]|nr:hypothetical protein [Chloroflexota bacterium]
MSRFTRFVPVFAVIVFLLSACNMPSNVSPPSDPNAVFTAAAQTAAVQLTRSAVQNPPTLPPSPPATGSTNTPLVPPTLPSSPTSVPPTLPPTQVCDKAKFISDVTVPDGTKFSPGETFTKTWRIKNIGTCTWTTSYAIVFGSGESMNGPVAQPLTGNVAPGQTVDISVNLTAPASDGNYTGYWKLRNASNVLFATVYVQIKVKSTAFAVTGVTYSVTTFNEPGYVGCPKVTASITTNGAGTVKYHWTRSDGSSGTVQTLVFGSAGTKTVESKWYLGSVWSGSTNWKGIYIDDPNHQDFGHVNVTPCTLP